MKKRNINFGLNETVHSSFSLMGHFNKSPKTKDILEGSTGTLNYHDGIAEVKMTPGLNYTFGSDGAFFTVSNEEDCIIYGYLEDGTYVRFNVFQITRDALNIPAFSSSDYTVYDLDLSRQEFASDNNSTYDHLIVTYDSLSEFGAFVIPDLMEENKNNSPLLIGENENFDVYLEYEWKRYGNRTNFTVKTDVELEIRIKNQNSEVAAFINDFGNFLSIINNSKVNTTSVRYFDKDNNVLRTHLFAGPHTERNGKVDYSYGISSEFNFGNYQDKLKQITHFMAIKDEKFNRLIQNYLYNIDDDLNLDSALINYVNSIDIYMKGCRYIDDHKVKGLCNKILFWLRQFPVDLYGLCFDKSKQDVDDDKRADFIRSLVDTRDYLTHFDKKNSTYLISNSTRFTYIKQIRALIHIYILHSYGVPDNCILNYYHRFIVDRIS